MADWWWSRNEHGFWCNVCGDQIKAPHQFEDDEDMDDYEPECCRNCGAPDEIDPEAI